MNLLLHHCSLITLDDLMLVAKWRNEQNEMLRNPRILGVEDQIKYLRVLHEQDAKRFSNTMYMWGLVTWDKDFDDKQFIGFGGLTNIVWGAGFVIRSESSFIADTRIFRNPTLYEEVFTFFLTELRRLFFGNSYWNGHRLYSESYDLPNRAHHISILEKNGFIKEGVMRHHVYIDGGYHDSIIHGLNRSDL
jgi:RimJ/RimL family protein N-acetyltransferase